MREKLVRKVCADEGASEIVDDLLALDAEHLARQLIEGVQLKRENLTSFLSKDSYSLRPLHNFFFTRDSATSIYNNVLISRMATG